MFSRVFFIVNPASGKPEPVLYTLNQCLSRCSIKWEIGVTNKENIEKLLRQARDFQADLLGIYGGDGTITEIAHRNLTGGHNLPMALLPGGTANILSLELGIPRALPEAVALITEGAGCLRAIDMAAINGHHFFTRAGYGLESKMVEGASRERKNQVGHLAYAIAGFQAFLQREMMHFRLELDGQRLETEGIACIVANCGNVGLAGLAFSPVAVDDGLLDVFVFRRNDVTSLFAAVRNIVGAKDAPENGEVLQHWRARHVTIESDAAAAHFDGQILKTSSIEVKILEHQAQLLTPVPTAQQNH